MTSRMQMHVALMKPIGRSEFAPITHWISHITPGNVGPSFRGNNLATLNTKAVGTRPLMFLLRIDGKVSFWGWLRWDPDCGRHRHQAAVPFHHINVLFRERNFYSNC